MLWQMITRDTAWAQRATYGQTAAAELAEGLSAASKHKRPVKGFIASTGLLYCIEVIRESISKTRVS